MFDYLLMLCLTRMMILLFHFFFFKQKTAYEMRISDWSSDVCSSDLETKVIDELFPRDEIGALGYPHLAISGMKGYNGVAILSKVPFAQHTTRDWCERADCRHIAAVLPDGTELHKIGRAHV